jgi:HSP20 family protein
MSDLVNAPQKERAEAAQPETTRGGIHFMPRVDIRENDNELTLFADLPGVAPGDVNLHYEQGELVLHGRVRPRQGGRKMLLREYDEGDFHRAFRIHESIDASKIEAEMKNGVLTIHLPKVEAVRPRQIAVKGA